MNFKNTVSLNNYLEEGHQLEQWYGKHKVRNQ